MNGQVVTKHDLDEAIGQISGAILKTLEDVATKDDLKNFATKDDLKNFATKDDLKNLATKDDTEELKTELMYVKTGIRDLKADAPTAKEFQKLEKRVDRLEKKDSYPISPTC